METIDIIRGLCKEKGISITKLEVALGYGNGSISKASTKAMRSDRLKAIADYFDVSMDFIFGRTDKPQGKNYKYKPKLDPEMARFVEMCFEPGTKMNKELRLQVVKMLSEEKK